MPTRPSRATTLQSIYTQAKLQAGKTYSLDTYDEMPYVSARRRPACGKARGCV